MPGPEGFESERGPLRPADYEAGGVWGRWAVSGRKVRKNGNRSSGWGRTTVKTSGRSELETRRSVVAGSRLNRDEVLPYSVCIG
jgi:hypothetical protein